MSKRCNNLSYRVNNNELDFIERYCADNKIKKTDMVLDGLYALGVFDGYEGETEEPKEEKPKPKKGTAKKGGAKKKEEKPKKTKQTKGEATKPVEPKEATKEVEQPQKKEATDKEIDKMLEKIQEEEEKGGKKKKIIIQLDKDGTPLRVFKGYKQLTDAGFNKGNVSQVCNKKKEKAHGFKWCFG